jgi:hypothetical protein
MQIEGLAKLPEHVLRSDVKREFTTFIQEFRDPYGVKKYEEAAKNAVNNSKHHIMFSFMDLIHHNHELANLIFGEYYKF